MLFHQVVDGMLIILKYQPKAELAAEHDQIWFGSCQPELMTEKEREVMEEMNWFEHDGSWSHYC